MIDPERILSIACGVLLLALLILSLALVSGVDWRRTAKLVRVTLEQMPDEDAQTLAVIVAFASVYGFLLVVYG
jgi:hypothetical protein